MPITIGELTGGSMCMGTLVSDRRSDIQVHDRAEKVQPTILDIKLLTHPVYTVESLTTLQRMSPDIEAYLRHNLVEPTSSRFRTMVNRTGAFLNHRLLHHKKPIVCACGRVLLKHGVCRICFERELEILRQMRPEMEAAIEAASHLSYENRQLEAHLLTFNAKTPLVLRRAVEQALKKWIFEVLRVHVQIWDSDIPSQGFRRETLKITTIAVPSEGLCFVDLLTTHNDKLPRRTCRPWTPPWVHAKGVDPYLVYPFDVGIMCGRSAIQVAVHQWEWFVYLAGFR